MKISIKNRTYAPSELTFLALYQNMEDATSYYYFTETLYSVSDGTYVLLCKGYAGSRYAMLNGWQYEVAEYAKQPDPVKWLMSRGHERLAGLLFSELRNNVEEILLEKQLEGVLIKGETFYRRGEAKGETFWGV
jgi:hypothetical protein